MPMVLASGFLWVLLLAIASSAGHTLSFTMKYRAKSLRDELRRSYLTSLRDTIRHIALSRYTEANTAGHLQTLTQCHNNAFNAIHASLHTYTYSTATSQIYSPILVWCTNTILSLHTTANDQTLRIYLKTRDADRKFSRGHFTYANTDDVRIVRTSTVYSRSCLHLVSRSSQHVRNESRK